MKNVIIGPFARIRDGVKIEKDSKVGNFVEVKKSQIGRTLKFPISYIGDSIIKNNCNIGAGAITCNYDGKKKNKTMIGENCFIGSNSSLVAPLKIKKGSLIGAGTVVNRDIPDGTVVYRKSELIKKNKKKVMCGIFGVFSNRPVVDSIIKGLSKLEYRGYDSSGISVLDKNNLIKTIRAKGKIINLNRKIKKGFDGHIGIGHTRWATHGIPSTNNAHPHTSESVSIVHNGIIENYSYLKKNVTKKRFSVPVRNRQ